MKKLNDIERRIEHFQTKTRTPNAGIFPSKNLKLNNYNWWSQIWLENFETLESSNRISQGKNYAKKGQVLYVKVQKGFIVAKVQGSKIKPYNVRIEFNKIHDSTWTDVLELISKKLFVIARLLIGTLPNNIDDYFKQCNVTLLPVIRDEMRAGCSCADWANPCKHTAAVFYVLLDMINHDPFLLFKIRGKTKEEALAIIDSFNGEMNRQDTIYSSNLLEVETQEKTNLNENINRNHLENKKGFIEQLEDAPFEVVGVNLKVLFEKSYKIASKKAKNLLNETKKK